MLTTHLAPRLKEEYRYTSTSLLEFRDLFWGELYFTLLHVRWNTMQVCLLQTCKLSERSTSDQFWRTVRRVSQILQIISPYPALVISGWNNRLQIPEWLITYIVISNTQIRRYKLNFLIIDLSGYKEKETEQERRLGGEGKLRVCRVV